MSEYLIPVIFLALVPSIIFFKIWRRWKQVEYIQTYNFPRGLYDKLKLKYPEFGAKEFQLVARALRQFFLAHLKSGKKYVSMPSQATDELWHEFILYTRSYDQFCKKAFGRFLHHTPAVVLSSSKMDNEGLRRVWWYSCKDENIDPRAATRLPLLFAIDKKLGIKNGFVYSPDCRRVSLASAAGGATHCGGDFSDSSFDGGTDGFGDSDSGGGDGDGGGDSGCGGGCGGD